MKRRTSLLRKFSGTLLFVAMLIGVSTLGIVVLMSAQEAKQHFAAVQQHIEQGIVSKGRVLTVNHALALRGLTLDNAFLDVQRLVERAVQDDQDLVYGLYVNTDKRTLAFGRRGQTADKDETPAVDRWKDLGFAEPELLVSAPRVERRQRLGQDLFEVAVPVVSEEGEALGTIRYGLSTRRMHEALAQAKHDSQARLRRSLWLIAALVGGATALGLVLSRFQAVKITRPVRDLTRAAEDLAHGKRSVRVDIDSGDELEVLGSSFNKMVEELDSSYRELEEMNRTLEHKVEQRTAELAVKNRDMRLVLDNVDQGFLTLSPQGIVSGEQSRVLGQWFGTAPAGVPFAEYLQPTCRAFALSFRLGWNQIEDGFLPLDVCLDQLPQQATNGKQTWSFRYLPFYKEGELEGVLVVVADITERLLREREEAEQNELMQGFKKLMLDRSGFTSFLREATQMVAQVLETREGDDLAPLKRTLHTLKGNAGVMGLTVVAKLCHTLEDELAEEGKMAPATIQDLRSRWTAITEHVERFTGGTSQRVIEIPEAEYAAIVSRLSRSDRNSDVLHQLLTWQLEPATRSLHRLGEQAKALARRLGKGDLEVEVRGGGVRLDPQKWTPFFADLGHVIRNAIDHGIEAPEDRVALGKPARPTLILKAEATANGLTFEVTDDGQGIDWQAIATKAKDHNLPHETQQDLVAALCSDGITTRSEVTDISGRGVGMAALKARVDALHGRVEVRSSRQVGTTWTLRFPLPEHARETAA